MHKGFWGLESANGINFLLSTWQTFPRILNNQIKISLNFHLFAYNPLELTDSILGQPSLCLATLQYLFAKIFRAIWFLFHLDIISIWIFNLFHKFFILYKLFDLTLCRYMYFVVLGHIIVTIPLARPVIKLQPSRLPYWDQTWQCDDFEWLRSLGLVTILTFCSSFLWVLSGILRVVGQFSII